MPERTPLSSSSPPEHIFPRLAAAQVARVAARGKTRPVAAGQVLRDAGESPGMFVVVSGQLEVVRPGDTETLVAVFGPGQFTGEMNVVSGRPGLVQVRVTEGG